MYIQSLVFGLAVPLAQASTLLPLTAEEIATRASTVVVATIEARRVWVDPTTGTIRTDLLLSDVTVLAGDSSPLDHLTYTGGEYGGRGMRVDGMPTWPLHTRAVFFVEGDGESEACPTVGWAAGFLPIDGHGHLQRPDGWLSLTGGQLGVTADEQAALTLDGLRAALAGRR